MKFQSFRSAVVVASVVIGSVIPLQAFAATDVLTATLVGGFREAGTATYRFTDSMILNSIGFVTDGEIPVSLSYTIKGTKYKLGTDFGVPNLSDEVNGFRWLTITPESMVATDIVTVRTEFNIGGPASRIRYISEPSQNTNVSFQGFDVPDDGNYTDLTNSNLRVSALPLGANVAPEPGTLALTLTGGCALLGMYIRRRKAA